jgi:hypothetical protein
MTAAARRQAEIAQLINRHDVLGIVQAYVGSVGHLYDAFVASCGTAMHCAGNQTRAARWTVHAKRVAVRSEP